VALENRNNAAPYNNHRTRQTDCLVSLSRFVAARQLTKPVALQGDTTIGPEIKHKERAKAKDTNNAYTPSVQLALCTCYETMLGLINTTGWQERQKWSDGKVRSGGGVVAKPIRTTINSSPTM